MADGNEIIVANEAAQPPALASTPMELLSRALERGADLSMVEKLMDLSDRHDKAQARKAFDAAIAQAKAKIKPVAKNREGNNQKRYADLAAYAKEIDPVLAEFGLSYRYRSAQDNGTIKVTCVLSHRDGHFEETTLAAAPDTSGNKNSIQAIGSTITYLQRYSLTLAIGLSASEDDDGRAAGGDEAINEDQLKELQDLASKSKADLEKLCAYFKIEALPDLRASQFQNAKSALLAKVAQAKKASKAGAPK